MSLAKIDITLEADRGVVRLDGEEVPGVLSVMVQKPNRMSLPLVTLQLQADVYVDGVAVVEGEPLSEERVTEALDELLGDVDPAQLERDALEALSMGDGTGPGSTAAAILRALREYVRGD